MGEARPAIDALVAAGEPGAGERGGVEAPGVPAHRGPTAAPGGSARAAEPVRPGGVGAGPGTGAVRLLLPDRDLRAGGPAGARLLRAAVPAGRADRGPGGPQGGPADGTAAGAVGLGRAARTRRDGGRAWPPVRPGSRTGSAWARSWWRREATWRRRCWPRCAVPDDPRRIGGDQAQRSGTTRGRVRSRGAPARRRTWRGRRGA
ncbi:hypothetical protein [Nocardioides convexus]|uniref:hypothetical protein n=1 Tax=Nocardioides convexus TaxID=2712224 RepID=UPI003100C4CB